MSIKNSKMSSDIIDISKITELILDEIALEGLEGCNLSKLISLLTIHETNLNLDLDDANVKQFIWKLVASQRVINFYQIKNQNKKEKQKPCVVNYNDELRGFCTYYEERSFINSLIRDENFNLNEDYQSLNNEIMTSIILVAHQSVREAALCPCYKNLKYENLTDLEYCVLEMIAKSRKNGIYTSGDGSLSQLFEIAPKQLHYVLSILEVHGFIVKNSVSSQKQRGIIYLKRFEQKNETNLEKILNYLNKKTAKQEFTHVLREKFNIGIKQFKNLASLGEKQNLFKRVAVRVPINQLHDANAIDESTMKTSLNMSTNDEASNESDNSYESDNSADVSSITTSSNKKSKNKTRCVRLLKLTSNQSSNNDTIDGDNEENDDNDTSTNGLIASANELVNKFKLCSEQDADLPLYTKMFKYIERCGVSGVSLKQLGYLYGLDFYKSRRIGAHLQTHPDIVTLVKETERGKAKYQTIIMRKFLLKQQNEQQQQHLQTSTLSQNEQDDTFTSLNIKNLQNKPIQAVASERSLKRKELILDYLEKRKICSKFEIDKEIRRVEELEKLKGQIDSKTTKRILIQLQTEKKVRLFEFNIKNKPHMGVCLPTINDKDEIYVNYMNTFSRSFDFCINKKSINDSKNTSIENDVNDENENENDDLNTGEFKLTRAYVQSIVKDLDFSFTYAKTYGLVSKIQKSIILHRYIHYILYFYDNNKDFKATNYDFLLVGNEHDTISNRNSHTNDKLSVNYSQLKAPPSKSLLAQHKEKVNQEELEKEYDIVNSSIPSACYSNKLTWKTFISPLKMSNNVPQNCLFISDILSHMPLSVFSSIVAINYRIPGLLSLLKHPYKRHMLLKDLPSAIIAAFIHDRRYLQRILSNLQFLACLNLITFVEHPTIENQAVNRTVESQMIYVHRQVYIRDTTKNTIKNWSELSSSGFDNDKYTKLTFKFQKFDTIIEYWKCLLNVSLNTYKFNVSANLKESKRLRSILHKKACKQISVKSVVDLKDLAGDNLGPGGYDSQLFLNSYANWTLPTYNTSSSNTSKSSNSSKTHVKSIISIDYDDKIDNVYSELVMQLPFGILRGFPSSNSTATTLSKSKKQKTKAKVEKSKTLKRSVNTEIETPKRLSSKKLKLESPKVTSSPSSSKNANKLLMNRKSLHFGSTSSHTELKTQKLKTINKKTNFKVKLANYFLTKAKRIQLAKKQNELKNSVLSQHKAIATKSSSQLELYRQNVEQKRAVWNKEEDNLILLIKIASLYFLPNEKTIQFKIIHDICNDLMPSTIGKKVKSFGRRMKVLLKSKLNRLYISNQLELCRQSKAISCLYSNVKLKRNSISNQQEQFNLYKRFIQDIKSKLNKNIDDLDDNFKLPSTKEQLFAKYSIKSQNDIFKQEAYFKQPECKLDIIKSTLHSAIHSSILVNDKTPRDYEASKLFEQYSDSLLTEVITTMSRKHNIIAPTKCSEMKKKNITAFSKHVGKAYHISQRYQYKWLNNMSTTLFNDAKQFQDKLIENKKYDCTDLDDAGMACYLAHTLENQNLDVKIDVPNKIWVSKFL